MCRTSVYLSPDQLQDKLATLSGLPSTFFTTLLQLDAIKKRNAEAMRVMDDSGPPQLPFFLPAIETTSGMAWLDEEESKELLGDDILVGKEDEATSKKRRKKGKRAMTVEELVLDPGTSILNSLIMEGSSVDAMNDEACKSICLSSSLTV